MDAGWRRGLAWRRRGRTGTDTGLPALASLATATRAGAIGERLSGTGGYSSRWAGACSPRQLRNRDKFDQDPVIDELSRRPSESRTTLELPAARRARRPLDRHRYRLRSRSGQAAT